MDHGTIEARSPDGRVWRVRRAWVPRYLTLRDRVDRLLAGRRRRWYTAPLRWFATVDRRELVESALDLPDSVPVGTPADAADPAIAPDADGAADVDLGFDPGGVDLPASVDPAGGPDPGVDVGFDGDEIVLVLLVVLAAVGAVLLAWFVLVPLLLLVVDGLVLLVVVLLAGLVRLLFRRPWDVVAEHDRADGVRVVRRWEVRGFGRAGRVRDDVAEAMRSGADADLAVARALAREPRDDDPPGSPGLGGGVMSG